jgi:hypothetical protein
LTPRCLRTKEQTRASTRPRTPAIKLDLLYDNRFEPEQDNSCHPRLQQQQNLRHVLVPRSAHPSGECDVTVQTPTTANQTALRHCKEPSS